MEKAVLISIQPKWCELIASGKKTVEVRKSKPKLKVPFKVYIYCTKNKNFFKTRGDEGMTLSSDDLYRLPNGEIKYGCSVELMSYGYDEYDENNFLNGKVIGEFVCDTIFNLDEASLFAGMTEINKSVIEEFSCVDIDDLLQYKGGKSDIYGWSITNLVIYEKPKGLWHFFKPCGDCDKKGTRRCTEELSDCRAKTITRPPQSWCYVEPLSVERDFTPPDFAPKTSYEDAFYTPYDGTCIVWMHYNPDSDAGGQYVTNFISLDDIKEAERKCIETDEFFDYLGSIAKQELADIGTEFFEGAEEQFLKEPTYCDRTEDTMNALIAFAHMQ